MARLQNWNLRLGQVGATGFPGITGSTGMPGTPGIPDDTIKSKIYLLDKIMSQYGITQDDLKEIFKVKDKIRDKNISEILNERDLIL